MRGNPRLASLNKGFSNESQAEKSKAWTCQNLVVEALVEGQSWSLVDGERAAF
jgi:hypothetical protein